MGFECACFLIDRQYRSRYPYRELLDRFGCGAFVGRDRRDAQTDTDHPDFAGQYPDARVVYVRYQWIFSDVARKNRGGLRNKRIRSGYFGFIGIIDPTLVFAPCFPQDRPHRIGKKIFVL